VHQLYEPYQSKHRPGRGHVEEQDQCHQVPFAEAFCA
jgi:hypothetical protein